MRFAVPSVHHSGTHFVKDELLAGYFEYFTNTEPRDFADFSKVLVHCEPENLNKLHKYLRVFAAIVPLRHPRAVARSWKARGKPLGPLPGQWDILINMVDHYEPFYIPVDSPDRDHYLDKLNRLCGVKLTTDWKVVQSSGKNAELSADEESMVQTILQQPFFERFYTGVSHVFRQTPEAPRDASSGSAIA